MSNRINRGLSAICALLSCLVVAASCGAGPYLKADSLLLGGAAETMLDAPLMLDVQKGKQTSGAPAGIFVTWTRSESNRAAGYFLYRDTESIPDPPLEGSLDLALRVNGGEMIPQPPDGETVTFNDLFQVEVGQTYFYRVTVADADELESDPSNEMSWTVHGQNVSGMTPTEAYWGELITITGDTFGTLDVLTDSVQFAGPTGSLAGSIQSWSDTQIEVLVPFDARTGVVGVVVDGTVANTDETLTILNPIIETVAPNPASSGQQVSISGLNFGAAQGSSSISWGAEDLSASVTSWSDSEIEITMGSALLRGDLELSVGGEPSNLAELVLRPHIELASLPAQQAGEELLLSGSGFSNAAADVPLRLLLDGTDELSVSSFSSTEIGFTLSGSVGPHFIRAVREDAEGDVASADFVFEILEPLSISLDGLSSGDILRPAAPPTVSAVTNTDAESVELLLDGNVIATLSAAPFSGFDLSLASQLNGAHNVALRAHRFGVSSESLPLGVFIYSLIGDINADGTVDSDDAAALDALIGLSSADSDYRIWYDSDEDGVVTEKDLAAVGYNFGNGLAVIP